MRVYLDMKFDNSPNVFEIEKMWRYTGPNLVAS